MHAKNAGGSDQAAQRRAGGFTTVSAARDQSMPAFAVFFSDERGVGVQPVLAMDAQHAQDIVRSRHPAAQLKKIKNLYEKIFEKQAEDFKRQLEEEKKKSEKTSNEMSFSLRKSFTDYKNSKNNASKIEVFSLSLKFVPIAFILIK